MLTFCGVQYRLPPVQLTQQHRYKAPCPYVICARGQAVVQQGGAGSTHQIEGGTGDG